MPRWRRRGGTALRPRGGAALGAEGIGRRRAPGTAGIGCGEGGAGREGWAESAGPEMPASGPGALRASQGGGGGAGNPGRAECVTWGLELSGADRGAGLYGCALSWPSYRRGPAWAGTQQNFRRGQILCCCLFVARVRGQVCLLCWSTAGAGPVGRLPEDAGICWRSGGGIMNAFIFCYHQSISLSFVLLVPEGFFSQQSRSCHL